MKTWSGIEGTTDKVKDKTFGSSIVEKASGYKTGAVVGAVAGFVAAYAFGRKKILFTIVGAVLGGYIGYKATEATLG